MSEQARLRSAKVKCWDTLMAKQSGVNYVAANEAHERALADLVDAEEACRPKIFRMKGDTSTWALVSGGKDRAAHLSGPGPLRSLIMVDCDVFEEDWEPAP